MLDIVIPGVEEWDDSKELFVYPEPPVKIRLEHSLVSLAKWEAKWHKPYLSSDKSDEEALDYIKCMTITQNVKESVYYRLSVNNVDEISAYIHDPMTATKLKNIRNSGEGGGYVTAELIYYAMIAYNIPFECQKWHLNRLLSLIEVCRRKNEPPKQMSQQEIMQQNARLNAIRKRSLHTNG